MNNLNSKKLLLFFLIICFLQIIYIFHFRSGFQFEIIKNPFAKNSGINYSLPNLVIESKKIIKENQINSFNLSLSIKENKAVYQRVIEFNYPIRLKNNSDIFFFFKEEIIPNECKIIDKGKYLYLTKC